MNDIILTDEQEALVQHAQDWFWDPNADQTLEYSAPAGAGKSLVLHCMIERLGLKPYEVAPMGFTGNSTLVMRKNGFINAKTIHASIFNVKEEYDRISKRKKRSFEWKGVSESTKLICLDESSMVGENLKAAIDRCGVKVIATGDINQLPPVIDKPAYLINPKKIFYLTKIMRQNENSAIVQLSRALLEGQYIKPGNYGQVQVIYKSDFLNHLQQYIKEYGIILCGTNKTRYFLNQTIRHDIFGYENPLPYKGEPLICRRNNWTQIVGDVALVNGLYGYAMSSPGIDSYESNFFLLDFRPEFMEESFLGLEVDYKYFMADYKRKREMKEELEYDFYERFEHAFAITTHLAQGSQFNSGIYVQEYFPNHSRNLNYTGLTRFRERALYVIPDRKKVWTNSCYHKPTGDRLIPVHRAW